MINKEILDNSTVIKVNIQGREILGLAPGVNKRVLNPAEPSKTISIPADPNNSSYQIYLEWIADGNSLDGEETEVSDADE